VLKIFDSFLQLEFLLLDEISLDFAIDVPLRLKSSELMIDLFVLDLELLVGILITPQEYDLGARRL